MPERMYDGRGGLARKFIIPGENGKLRRQSVPAGQGYYYVRRVLCERACGCAWQGVHGTAT